MTDSLWGLTPAQAGHLKEAVAEFAIIGIVSLLFSSVLVFAFEHKWKWRLLAISLLPCAAIALCNSATRVYSNHGLMHISAVYRIMEAGAPPTNPLFGNTPLLYPWAHYVVIAFVSQSLDISPATAFVLLNLALLAGAVVVLYRLGSILFEDEQSAVLATILPLFATSIIHRTPACEYIERATGFHIDSRGIPLSEKFSNINSMPLGFVFFSLFLYLIVVYLLRPVPRTPIVAGLLVAMLGAALFYPLIWIGQLVCLPAAILVLSADRSRPRRILDVLILGTSAVVVTTVALPYVWSITSARTGVPLSDLVPTAQSFAGASMNLLVTLAPLGVFSILGAASLREAFTRRPAALWFLLLAMGSLAVFFIVVSSSATTHFQYKYKVLSVEIFCVLSALPLAGFMRARPRAGHLVLTLLLFPFSADVASKLLYQPHLVDPFYEEGQYLRHADTMSDAMYRWIHDHSEVDAVFIDTQLGIPVFARRQLYSGLDMPRSSPDERPVATGWTPTVIEDLVEINGYPRTMVEERQDLVSALLREDGTGAGEAARAALDAVCSDHPLYVVARDEGPRQRLARDDRFELVFDNPSGRVFRCVTGSNR